MAPMTLSIQEGFVPRALKWDQEGRGKLSGKSISVLSLSHSQWFFSNLTDSSVAQQCCSGTIVLGPPKASRPSWWLSQAFRTTQMNAQWSQKPPKLLLARVQRPCGCFGQTRIGASNVYAFYILSQASKSVSFQVNLENTRAENYTAFLKRGRHNSIVTRRSTCSEGNSVSIIIIIL